MLTIEEIRLRLRNHKLIKVAEEVRLNRSTVSAVMNDDNARPSYETLRRLSEYLEA